MRLLMLLGTAIATAAASGSTSPAPSSVTPALPALRVCSDAATIRAEEKCSPRLHSSRVDYGIRPEVRVVLSCGVPPGTAAETLIEKSLFETGFDVMNARRLGPEVGETFTRGMTIYAIDGQSMIWVNGAPTIHRPPDPFFVHLMMFSRPPAAATRQSRSGLRRLAARLEQGSCKVVKDESAENGPESAGTYDDLAFYVRHSLTEAQRKAPSSKAFKVHAR